MPELTAFGNVQARTRLQDAVSGNEIQLDLTLYEPDSIVLRPAFDDDPPAELRLIYDNSVVRLNVTSPTGRQFSVTLWDYFGRTVSDGDGTGIATAPIPETIDVQGDGHG